MNGLITECTFPGSISPVLPGEREKEPPSVTPRSPSFIAEPAPLNILVVISDVLDSDVLDSDVLDSDVLDSDVLDSDVLDSDVLDSDVLDSDVLDSDVLDSDPAPQPTTEGLCADGLRFTDVWSYLLCSPTRAAMMTGRYGWRTNVGRALDEDMELLSPDEVTLPDLIDGGTSCIDKWHLTRNDHPEHPHELGWSHFSGTVYGAVPDCSSYEKVVNGEKVDAQSYATTEVVDDALDWLAEQDDEPWMMWVSFNAPHTPLHAPPTELHSVDLKTLSLESPPVPFFQAMAVELGRLLDSGDRDNTVIRPRALRQSERLPHQHRQPRTGRSACAVEHQQPGHSDRRCRRDAPRHRSLQHHP